MSTRSISQIQQGIIASKNAQASLNGLNSTSQVSVWGLWIYITAIAIWTSESLWSLFQSQLETQISNSIVWTPAWIQEQSFLFQYDAVTPQILTLNNFVPSYSIVDTTKQIISRCSVSTLANSLVSVKCATQNPPIALSTQQLTSFQGYLDILTPAGVSYTTISLNPDQVYINMQLFYNGQYTSTIQTAVQNSITSYMAGIPFDGYFRLSSLEETILATPGVTDLIFNNVAIYADSVGISGATYMVQSNTEVYNKSLMTAGYCIPTTASGYTLATSVNYIIGS